MTSRRPTTTDDLLARTLREEAGPLVARLSRRFGDFDLAEEAVQGAVVEALTSWRRNGPPDRPGAWLQVAATRNAMDGMRHRDRQRALAHRTTVPAREAYPRARATDDRLALLFACCHPALAPEARLALTLRAVVGLTTPQIARAFLVHEATLAQRIVRAKRKIVAAGIALTVPPQADLTTRLDDVLAVVYVMFNEGFVSSTGPTQDRDLAADAVWLAGVIATSLPEEAEAWGLAALLTIQHARSRARFADGDLVLLRDQDRRLWDTTRSPTASGISNAPPRSASRAATSSRPRSQPCTRRVRAGPGPTGCRSRCSTRSWPATTHHPSYGSTASSHMRRSSVPGMPSPASSPSPDRWRSTTSSTPPAPSSSRPSGATTRPRRPTGALSS